jgi:tRNA wybutosine-synthesizing protein 3
MQFEQKKTATLDALRSTDSSRQGHVDAEVVDLLDAINAHTSYYTTSSCAGRILIYEDHPSKHKQDVRWLLSSHQEVSFEEVNAVLANAKEHTLWLRFEPLILHVCCKTIEDAHHLITLVHDCGFKHSGVLSLQPRIIVEVLGSERIDVPLAQDGKIAVDATYLRFLVDEANKKMVANMKRREELKKKISQL